MRGASRAARRPVIEKTGQGEGVLRSEKNLPQDAHDGSRKEESTIYSPILALHEDKVEESSPRTGRNRRKT